MSEYDAAGFTAVEKFFGGGDDGARDSSSKPGLEVRNSNDVPKGNRRGVGSKQSFASKGRDDLTNKLLKIGRKRRRGEDDEETNENETMVDEDEDEAGRTAIATQTQRKISLELDTSIVEKPKKKLGKKERKRLQHQDIATDVSPSAVEDEEKARKTHEIQVVDENDQEASGASQKKHKRRKVRSKQKNIRKDNREKKPDHLVVGRRNYQGRPLTAETREKLNIAAPKARTPFQLERSPSEDVGDVGGLGIDSLLEEDIGMQVKAQDGDRDVKDKKKKSKKPRYKNLKV